MLVGFMIWMLFRQMKGGAMQAMTFGQSRAKIIDPNDVNNRVTFDDVAGCKEAKIELVEIVDFLKNPKKFLDIGARVPKGVLLTGSPGTGKTMLARAVAGEAQVPFFHLSGSEFVEMFAGVGASRVRDLFQMAKKAAPAIVFVDEIDAVGRMRGIGNGGNNDEREQTLNQILVEMDGFEPNEKVIVMAATNRSDVLDPALLRPGRFDRHVTLDLPDRIDREAILVVHAKKKPLADDVNLKVIAERTPGFSGADLYSIMNEGAILAAREDRKEVSQSDLIKSIEKVMLGPERKSHLMTEEEKKITAYHEAGHALVASVLPHADPVHKISIISRGRAGGYTIKLPLDDRKLQSRQTFLDDLAMSLGGYVVEKMVFGDVTTGPSNDLQVASDMARRMVTEWGMSEVIGPVAVETSRTRLYRTQGIEEKTYSETIATRIDEEVKRLMSEARDRAEEVVTKYRHVLDAIANKLIEVETLEQDAYNELISSFGIKPKTV
jgi:cell division protease FtsH